MSDRFEVVRVAALPVAAEVIDDQPIWYLASPFLIRHTMSQ